MFKKMMNKNLLLAVLTLGVLFVLATPDAMAQDRCRSRSRYTQSNYNNATYYDDRNYDNRNYDSRNYRDRNYRTNDRSYDDRYYGDYENTNGKAVKRTAIGAGIGAVGGALIGGKKGALIGAGVGAAGGYLYHRNRTNNGRRY